MLAIHVSHEYQKDRFVSFVEGLFYHDRIFVFDGDGFYVFVLSNENDMSVKVNFQNI